MIEKVCNIWDKYDCGETVCITTNGFVNSKGFAVMGRGVAAQAVKRFPTIKGKLGQLTIHNGNIVQRLVPRIISFPVKPQLGICNEDKSNVVLHIRRQYRPYSWVPGWAMMADLNLIECSLEQLNQLRDVKNFEKIYLPKPGCGAGGLDWVDVKPYCERYGDWLIVCDLS